MSTLLEQYDHALTGFDARMALVREDQWPNPTPCTDWDVRALAAHVTDEQRWAPYLLGGGSVAGAGDRFSGDPLGDDPLAAWQQHSGAARVALHAEGALDRTVALSYGVVSARDYLWELTVDTAVHTWDLARGIGAEEQLDPELVRRIHAETEKDVDRLAASGRFDPPMSTAAHADLQARTLALFGRRA